MGRRATQRDDRNEYAHWAFGISGWDLHKHDDSVVALERAVDLNPNCSLDYGSLGTVLGLVGRTDDAIANQEIAIRSNTRDPNIFFHFSSIAMASHVQAGRLEACQATLPDIKASDLDRIPLQDLARMETFRALLRKASVPD